MVQSVFNFLLKHADMTDTIELAKYLFKRLQQLGVGSVHGVPGKEDRASKIN